MGRGRKGLIDQSIKKNRKPTVFYDLRNPSYIIQSDPIGNPVYPPVLPTGVIDLLKQMDPKVLAALLLE